MRYRLNEKWIKASIAGTIWAASEIVLGSFLHNLRIPFSGNILTAIGLILLISTGYKWSEKGLFWRAGLICALMKTMSPSAVIFGPMIAIFSEALLLELFVRLLGRNIAGYISGAMAAMSWNLFQKIANYIIFYGSNIIEVYSNLLKMAQKQLNIQTDIVWLPIIILLIVYALFGALAALIGIRIGRKILKQPYAENASPDDEITDGYSKIASGSFSYSIAWLCIDLVLIVGSFVLLNLTPWFIWSIAIILIVILWSFRYKRAVRQLSRPKFWIFFVFITLITAFVFTKAESGRDLLRQGLLTGFQMNFRAVVVILGFSVLGTELYNPVIRNFFLKTSFKNLPIALELSVESLPAFVSNMPDFTSLMRDPVLIFSRVISVAEKRLNEIKEKNRFDQKVFIITGSVREGKTACVKNLVEIFRQHDIRVGGILSERVMKDSDTIGYDLVNIETGEKEIFLRKEADREYDRIGKFGIYPGGLAFGNAVLNSLIRRDGWLAVIDEVGLLELQDMGWSSCINDILKKSRNHLIITVRNTFTGDVIKKWEIPGAVKFNIHETDYPEAWMIIMKQIEDTGCSKGEADPR
jgi:nucleoside-triphosphatase THEP1